MNEKFALRPPEAMKKGEAFGCTAVLLRDDKPLLMRCHWLAANGQQASEAFEPARQMRIGRRTDPHGRSAGFICGFQGTIERTFVPRAALHCSEVPSRIGRDCHSTTVGRAHSATSRDDPTQKE